MAAKKASGYQRSPTRMPFLFTRLRAKDTEAG